MSQWLSNEGIHGERAMSILDEHEALLRAMLAADVSEYERIAHRLDVAGGLDGYNMLVASAFCLAVRRRFFSNPTAADIIRFVGEQRARLVESQDDFDPLVAEQLIRSALGHPSDDSVDDETKANAQLAILMGIVDDEIRDDVALEEFVAEARQLAESAISQTSIEDA
jgi:hypothetical protein